MNLFPLLCCMAVGAVTAAAAAVQVIPDDDFDKPDAKAQDCLDALKALHLVQDCQQESLWRFSPERMHTDVTTDWEMCCQVHEELICYERNADRYCPKENAASVGKYVEQNLFILANSVCTDPGYQEWSQYCANLTKEHEHRMPEFRLPGTNDTDVQGCLGQLQKHSDDLVQKECREPIQRRLHWEKTKEQDIDELCCAWYQMLECVEEQSHQVCSGQQQARMEAYAAGIRASHRRWCRSMPYGEHDSSTVLSPNTQQRCHRLGFDLVGDNYHSWAARAPAAGWLWLLAAGAAGSIVFRLFTIVD